MSSFIVESDVLNRAVSLVDPANPAVGELGLQSWAAQQLAGHGFDVGGKAINTEGELRALGKALRLMNLQATAANWGMPQRELTAQALPYRWARVCASPMAAFKALECLLYQLRGSESERCPLFATLDGILREVAFHLLHALPEYEAEPWGTVEDQEPRAPKR